jgi:allantoate deiminase
MVIAVASGARAVARCIALGVPPYSDSADGLFRAYLTPAWAATLDKVTEWMRDAGMGVRRDAAGNLIGRYEGQTAAAPALMIGSHIDSVPMAGHYDGPLGIMLGIEAVAVSHQMGRRLPFAIEVIAFGDEEGSRFPAAMITSRAVGGTTATDLESIRDKNGVSLSDALAVHGLNAAQLGDAARARGDVIAYLEAHIEQGPVLEAAGLPLGVVTGIAAQLRLQVEVTGMAGHAGTTPMGMRRDAVAGAAEMIGAIEAAALAHGNDLVATIGKIEAFPGAANVIAQRARFTIDLRSGSLTQRNTAAANIAAKLEAIAARRGLSVSLATLFDLSGCASDDALTELLCRAVAATGQTPMKLVSGAGHDAISIAPLCPTAMLFIRCAGGISHHPSESVDPADADAALLVISAFIDLLEADYRA